MFPWRRWRKTLPLNQARPSEMRRMRARPDISVPPVTLITDVHSHTFDMSGEESKDEVNQEAMGSPMSGMPTQSEEETPMVEAAEPAMAPAPPKAGGKRTQLKVMRERVQSLTKEVGDFRKSHEVSTKKLEAGVASLRKDLAHVRSKDIGEHLKGHGADTKHLQKQVATLRKDLASMKAQMAKEASKSKAREKALMSEILARVRTAKPSKKSRAKKSK